MKKQLQEIFAKFVSTNQTLGELAKEHEVTLEQAMALYSLASSVSK